ncbi:MAG: ROK family protein [Verrucomicrobiota bacterium]
MEQAYFGIEIGGTKLQIVAGVGAGVIRKRERLNVDQQKGAAGIRQQIESTLSSFLNAFEPQAVGVGFGGPVDWQTGRIARSHQIEGWADFELAPWLRSIVNKPTFVDNDANVAALGEAFRGAGVHSNPVFYITLGSGVGGGLVLNGEIYHGAKPGESEIGHLRLDRQGTTLESRCSGWAVDAKIRQLISKEPASILSRQISRSVGGESKHLVQGLYGGDQGASKILEELADDLSFGLSHVVHLFHPETIILGGGLSLIGEPLRVAVEAALKRSVMEVFSTGVKLRIAALGEDSVLVGSLLLAERGSKCR